MNLIFTTQSLDKIDGTSIFLAGPTPRHSTVKSWRPEAVELFKSFGYKGNMIIPEIDWNSGKKFEDLKLAHSKIIDWEHDGLSLCDMVVFWIPRNMDNMLALTTSIEFGFMLGSGKIIYGRPDSAPRNEYLDYCYKKACGKRPFNDLKKMVKFCCREIS